MLCRLAAALLLVVPAFAGQVTYTNQLPYQPVIGPSWTLNTYTVDVPQFDPHIGRLNRVYVFARLDLQGAVSIENVSPGATYSGFYIGASGSATLCDFTSYGYFDYVFSAGQLAPFDGTIDYAGPSGAIITFPQPAFPGPMPAGGWSNDLGSGVPGVPLGSTSPSSLDSVTGIGTLQIVIEAHPNVQPQWDTTLTNWSSTMEASPRVEITYYYDDYPARFCTGLGPGGQDWLPVYTGGCPCTGGAPNGCPNSVNPSGANLAWSGQSSVSADNLSLIAIGMPATTTVLFFQGTTAPNVGAWFGDGKRCVGGILTRLGVKHAANGAATYPGPGDQTISVMGNIPVGTLRSFQVWYRNADDYCTPATFNLTSAVATVWTP
jgi:hypothetical protein